jgi:hypothetical protein
MTVYLLHFNKPYGDKHKVQHYLGYTARDTIEPRMKEHLHGHGNPLVKAVLAAGIEVQVAKVWLPTLDENGNPAKESTRWFEKKLKHAKNLRRVCPICMLERKNTRPL